MSLLILLNVLHTALSQPNSIFPNTKESLYSLSLVQSQCRLKRCPNSEAASFEGFQMHPSFPVQCRIQQMDPSWPCLPQNLLCPSDDRIFWEIFYENFHQWQRKS